MDQLELFIAWMKQVDLVLTREAGVTSQDLPDFNWHDLFEFGYSPKDAVIEYTEADFF